MPYINH